MGLWFFKPRRLVQRIDVGSVTGLVVLQGNFGNIALGPREWPCAAAGRAGVNYNMQL